MRVLKDEYYHHRSPQLQYIFVLMEENQELEEKSPPPLELVDRILQFSVLLHLSFLPSNGLYSL